MRDWNALGFRLVWSAMFLACTLGGLRTAMAIAHPFHVCIGQMEWNAPAGVWELSLRLHPQDLERALLAQGARSASLEDPGFSDTALAFLQDQFFLVDLPAAWTAEQVNEWLENSAANDTSLPKSSERSETGADPGTAAGDPAEVAPERLSNRSYLRWVGMETERGWLWLHLELSPPTASDSGKTRWLAHRIFLDSIDRQENSVRIVQGSHRSALQFQKNAPARPMPTIAP